jgi:hypothetical protein
MARIMLDPDVEAPNGWIVARTEDEMMRAMDAMDPVELEEMSMRGDLETCVRVSERAAKAALSAFHLLGGMSSLKAVHFHHHDLAEAEIAMEACRRPLRTGGMGVELDAFVPLGDHAIWVRRGAMVDLKHVLPEAIAAAMVGEPLTRLVQSPMITRRLVVRSILTTSDKTIIMLED